MKPYELMALNEVFFTFGERIRGFFNNDYALTSGALILLKETVHFIEQLERRKKEQLLKDVIEIISYEEDIPIERLQVLIDSVDFQP